MAISVSALIALIALPLAYFVLGIRVVWVGGSGSFPKVVNIPPENYTLTAFYVGVIFMIAYIVKLVFIEVRSMMRARKSKY